MKLFHYTLGIKLKGIFDSGYINTSPLKPKRPEKPICWLSSNAVYEKSAVKMAVINGETCFLTIEQMIQHGQGLYRLVFDSNSLDLDVLPWDLLRPKSKLSPVLIKRLLTRAKHAGSNPKEWYGTLDQVLHIETAMLEVCVLGSNGEIQWKPVNINKMKSINSIDSTQVFQSTVDDLVKKFGVNLECTDHAWKQSHSA